MSNITNIFVTSIASVSISSHPIAALSIWTCNNVPNTCNKHTRQGRWSLLSFCDGLLSLPAEPAEKQLDRLFQRVVDLSQKAVVLFQRSAG